MTIQQKRHHPLAIARLLMLSLFCVALLSGCSIFRNHGSHQGNATGPAPSAQQLTSAGSSSIFAR